MPVPERLLTYAEPALPIARRILEEITDHSQPVVLPYADAELLARAVYAAYYADRREREP